MMIRMYLHSELSRAHASHGVDRDDYDEYSSYCTRKLSRLRHSGPVRKDLLHCRMYKNSLSTRKAPDDNDGVVTSRARHAYRAIDITNLPREALISSPNYFLEPLYSAERCWASSLAIRSEDGGDRGRDVGVGVGVGGVDIGHHGRGRWSPGKVRSRSIKRLRKAVSYATLLEALAHGWNKAVGTDESATGCGDIVDGRGEGDGVSSSCPPVDEHTRMETRAYASWMRGNLALEQERWVDACVEYRTSLVMCELIAASSSSSSSIAEEERGDDTGNGNEENDDDNDVRRLELYDFFTTRARNVIGPLLRYCQYEVQETGMSPTDMASILQSSMTSSPPRSKLPVDDPFQSNLLSLGTTTLQTQATGESSMSHVVFRDNSIGIETKETRMALLKVQDFKADWERLVARNDKGSTTGDDDIDAKFMALLSGYDDVISLVNHELKQLATLKSGPAVNAKKFRLVNIIGYCKYQKLRMVMCRNEDLANDILLRGNVAGGAGKKLKHLEEVTHLYDALVQDARAVASLPGGGSPEDYDGDASTATAAVEDEFLLEANANVLRLRSLRCYYLARMHSSPLVRKYAEASSLFDHAESLAREAVEEIGACDRMEDGAGLVESLEGVLMDIRGGKCRALAASYSNTNASSTSSKCILERLYDYDIPSASAPLCHVPPKLEPMACKPSFFDVALNYVSDYPVEELRRALEERGGDRATINPRKGLLGWFRG